MFSWRMTLAAIAVGVLLAVGACWVVVDTGRMDQCRQLPMEEGNLVWTNIVAPKMSTHPVVRVQDAKSIEPSTG